MTSDDKQVLYRDARSTGQYDAIWQSVQKCVFCDLREKYIFFEENGIVMTISLYAYIDGHFMIVPRRHVTAVRELTQLEWDTIRKFMYLAKKMVHEVHGIKGLQFVQKDGSDAQSTVGHIHFHCIPFDAPDLCKWNYRALQYTPLENVALYKAGKKKIMSHYAKFERKYKNRSSLAVVCDAVIFNSERQVLLQERSADAKLIPDALTLPGGTVEDFSVPLESELLREIREETSLEFTPADCRLLDSRLGRVTHRAVSRPLGVAYPQVSQFVWNTYLVTADCAGIPVAGDDCQAVVWVPYSDLSDHPRVSSELAAVITKAYTSRYVGTL